MATLQIRVDDALMQKADGLFSSLGMDTSTAVRIFLNAAVEHDGIPFPIGHAVPGGGLMQAVADSRSQRNLFGPFDTPEEALTSMLEA